MENIMAKIIPKNLWKKGLKLNSWGINEIAWKKNDSLEVIDYLLQTYDVGLSGGDVYFLKNSELIPSYDNWFCDPLPSESIQDFNKRSLRIAKKYIKNYPINTEDNTLFSFVFSDYVVFEDEE
jgi:hypothetical protein